MASATLDTQTVSNSKIKSEKYNKSIKFVNANHAYRVCKLQTVSLTVETIESFEKSLLKNNKIKFIIQNTNVPQGKSKIIY